jgi:hypothetical protein
VVCGEYVAGKIPLGKQLPAVRMRIDPLPAVCAFLVIPPQVPEELDIPARERDFGGLDFRVGSCQRNLDDAFVMCHTHTHSLSPHNIP